MTVKLTQKTLSVPEKDCTKEIVQKKSVQSSILPTPTPTQGGGQLINTHIRGKNYYSDTENMAIALPEPVCTCILCYSLKTLLRVLTQSGK